MGAIPDLCPQLPLEAASTHLVGTDETSKRSVENGTRRHDRLEICVVMATYNGSPHLEAQLKSISSQQRPPDLLIVGDDHSSDDTFRILGAFADQAAFPVRIFQNERNLGYRRNFEQAMRQAHGDVVVLSDQDDIWRTDRIARIEDAFVGNPDAGLVFSDAEVVDEFLRPLGFSLWNAVRFDAEKQSRVRDGRALDVLVTGFWVTGATMAFRSHFLDLVLPLDDEAVHDAWIGLLIAAVAEVEIVAAPLIAYRQHEGNQIGASRTGLFTRLARARTAQRRSLEEMHGLLLRVRDRLRVRAQLGDAQGAVLDDAISHLQIRLALPRARIRRIPPIWGELARGRYAARANGFSSAFRDLLIG
jgi:glycosyltransferase involved in cell wall biosynthesis